MMSLPKMPLLRIALLVGTGAVAACSLLRGPQSLPPLPLLSPADFSVRGQIMQRVTVSAEHSESTFLAAWVVKGQRLDFVGLTPSGQRLLALSYNGREFTEDYSRLLEESIPGRDVLGQLQLAHWPLESIERALAGSEWRLEEQAGQRKLYYRGRPILTITGSQLADGHQVPATITIQSQVAPYRLTVETLEVAKQ